MAEPFWRTKTLEEMSRAEWESLCDGCGRCCVLKVEDEETREVFHSSIVCELFDLGSCRCTRYPERIELVEDCVVLDPATVHDYTWLPDSCAYRRLATGRDLAWWHPLVSESHDTVVEAGISVFANVVSAADIHPDDLDERLASAQESPLVWIDD